VEQRNRREIDHHVQLLRNCLDESNKEWNPDPYLRSGLEEITSFLIAGLPPYERLTPADALHTEKS